jgi:hypothetical protein
VNLILYVIAQSRACDTIDVRGHDPSTFAILSHLQLFKPFSFYFYIILVPYMFLKTTKIISYYTLAIKPLFQAIFNLNRSNLKITKT